LEALEFLIGQGADVNARTDDGMGSSVLNIAKEYLDPEDPVYVLLSNLGAEDWEDEEEGDGDEEYENEEDYEYEDWEYEDWEEEDWKSEDFESEENGVEDDKDEGEILESIRHKTTLKAIVSNIASHWRMLPRSGSSNKSKHAGEDEETRTKHGEITTGECELEE
jgi:hypothetical protein